MSAKPILTLQLQRLGDLILTFPLLIDLQRRFPASPLHIVAEPQFFLELMPFAPNAVFFPPERLHDLENVAYEAVFNLSSGREAAIAAANIRAEMKFGPFVRDGARRISGYWQLYRAALTHNNRHNAFHWADLYRLDLGFPLSSIAVEKMKPPKSGRIGLFIGASEVAKKPFAEFWIGLARRLVSAGFKPFLLGGPAEKDEGALIAAKAGIASFCGKTSLAQLAAIIRTLDLFVSPDTGPMHLADWLGARVLNLSLGNVNARETGPVGAGQFVLRSGISCYGCWSCHKPRQYCRTAFNPRAASKLVEHIAAGGQPAPAAGLRLAASGRDASGLYCLKDFSGQDVQDMLRDFWKNVFLYFSGAKEREAQISGSVQALNQKNPRLCGHLRASLGKMLGDFSRAARKSAILEESFWMRQPWHSRLYAGHIHLSLQNADYSRRAMLEKLDQLALLEEIFARAL